MEEQHNSVWLRVRVPQWVLHFVFVCLCFFLFACVLVFFEQVFGFPFFLLRWFACAMFTCLLVCDHFFFNFFYVVFKFPFFSFFCCDVLFAQCLLLFFCKWSFFFVFFYFYFFRCLLIYVNVIVFDKKYSF